MKIYPEELADLLPGKRGEALDDDAAVAVLRAAQKVALDESFDALEAGRFFDHWFAFLSALNEADVVLVWDGPADPPSVVDAMRSNGWSDNEIGAAMDGRYKGAALDDGAVNGKAQVADQPCEPTEYCHNGMHHSQTSVDEYDEWPCPKVKPVRPGWMDHADPHMDGSVTYTMPKYADRPGQVRVTLPAPVVADLHRWADGSVPTEADR